MKLAKIWEFIGGLRANIGHFSFVLGRIFFMPLIGTFRDLNFMYMCQGLVEKYETKFLNQESLNEKGVPHTKNIKETVEQLA